MGLGISRKTGVWPAAAVLALGLGLAACDSGEEAEAPVEESAAPAEEAMPAEETAAEATDAKPFEGETLTVVSWGGAYTAAQVGAYHDSYEEESGVDIQSEDYDGNIAPIRAQVEAGNVTWDVVDVNLAEAVLLCDEGLVEPIDHDALLLPAPDGTPPSEDFIDGSLLECAAPITVWSNIIAYDSTVFPENPPSSLADFFDTATYPGKRALRKTPLVNLEFALMADGVPTDEVYDVLATPEGQDRAFAKLDTIKDEIIWWEAGAQPPQLLADGEVAMTSAFNGRIFNAQTTEDQPFEIIWDGQVWDLDLWVIPKDGPHEAVAEDFVRFATSTENLARQARLIAYSPSRKSSMPLVTTHLKSGIDMAPHMGTAPGNFDNALQMGYEFWADHLADLEERFNAWLAQ